MLLGEPVQSGVALEFLETFAAAERIDCLKHLRSMRGRRGIMLRRSGNRHLYQRGLVRARSKGPGQNHREQMGIWDCLHVGMEFSVGMQATPP